MLKFLAVSTGLFALLVGCGGSPSTAPSSALPQRQGSVVESTPAKFKDVKPSLSADGTKLVFISGRESDDQSLSFKAFKATWPDGGAVGALSRLTGSEIGSEAAASVSPDGKWAVVTVEKDGQSLLYLQDYSDASRAPVKIPNEGGDPIDPVFSSNSEFLAWISRDFAAGTSQLLAVTIGTGTDADVATVTPMSTTAEYVSTAFWLPTENTGSYQLAIGTQGDFSTGATSINSIQFSALSEAKTAARTSMIAGKFLISNILPRAASGMALLAVKSDDSKQNKMTALGGGTGPRTTLVASEPLFVGTDTTQAALTTPLGHAMVGLGGISTDGKTGFGLFSLAYRDRCNADATTYDIARSIGMFKADGSTTSYYVPRTTTTEGVFEVAKDVCDMTRADGSTGRPDGEVMDVVVNADAADSKFRALYVTWFTQHFDESCVLKDADPEIYGLDISAGKATIQAVSANRANIVDTPPTSGTTCTL